MAGFARTNRGRAKMSANSLDHYLDNLDGLIKQLTPAQTRALNRELGQELRRRNAARIKANIEPDGAAFVRRKGEAWKARALKEGETLKPSQKFGFYKGHNLQLKNVIDRGNRLVGVETTEGNPGYAASGFLKKFIYIQRPRASGLMFRRLPGSRWLKSKTTTAEAAIGFMSGLMGQIAAEHQSGNPKKNLPARELIGFGKDDLVYIEQTVVAPLAKS